jgi:N-acetyl-gamma-glutamyl-phosphate reductase
MERGLALFAESPAELSFTPHLVPMTRGLLVTARARLDTPLADGDALEILEAAYDSEPFVRVTTEWPRTKSVLGSNGATVSARVDERTGWLIASAAIDNLGKGAAGQAIQSANVALGIDETTGLTPIGMWP